MIDMAATRTRNRIACSRTRSAISRSIGLASSRMASAPRARSSARSGTAYSYMERSPMVRKPRCGATVARAAVTEGEACWRGTQAGDAAMSLPDRS
jgi:hypothetical protein